MQGPPLFPVPLKTDRLEHRSIDDKALALILGCFKCGDVGGIAKKDAGRRSGHSPAAAIAGKCAGPGT